MNCVSSGVSSVNLSVVRVLVMNDLMVVVVSVVVLCLSLVILLFLIVVMIEVDFFGVFRRMLVVELLYMLL